MTDEQIDTVEQDERGAFEAWARKQPKHVIKDLQRYPDNHPDKSRAGQYGHCTTADAWGIWQAARASSTSANVAQGVAIAIRPDQIAEIANKYALGNPRLDALLGFVNEVIIVNGAEYAKSE